ncbi:MAG: 2-methylcitrate dehydratase PrpD [Paraglaciecola sp.]|jgi:2-methylcitrate dehydratase PrpD
MTKNHTKELVSSLQQLMQLEPSVSDRKQVSRCLLDYLGATLAGVRILKTKTDSIASLLGGASGGVSAVGMDSNVSLETAALINGLNSHVAEMDDGVRFGMIHPGAPIFSALLPLAEKLNVRGIDFIKGVLVGYDAALRLASAMQPTHYRRGYHPTATCGSIGATMGIAAMLGFNAKEMEDALGAVSVAAGGSLKVVGNSSELKPYNVGRASALAIQSAVVGKSGFTSPIDVLNGDTGFLKMTTDSLKSECLHKMAPKNYWIHSVYVKPYAACRHAHPSIEATLDIIQQEKFSIRDIKKICVITYHGLKGRHDLQEVSCVAGARMSIPFSVAIALSSGGAGVNEFTQEAVEEPDNIALSKKIIIQEDQKYTDRVPDQRSAMIKLELHDGVIFTREIIYPKGEPESPMDDQELKDKYKELAMYGEVTNEAIELLMTQVWLMPDNLKNLFGAIKNCNLKGSK